MAPGDFLADRHTGGSDALNDGSHAVGGAPVGEGHGIFINRMNGDYSEQWAFGSREIYGKWDYLVSRDAIAEASRRHCVLSRPLSRRG